MQKVKHMSRKGYYGRSQEHGLNARGISTKNRIKSCGLESKSIDQFVVGKIPTGNYGHWHLDTSEYVLRTINPNKVYHFKHKPTVADLKKIFKDRVRGTGNFSLWKSAGGSRMFYEAWLGAQRRRYEYEYKGNYKVPIEVIK